MKIPMLGSVSTLSLYLAFVIPSYAGERTIEAPLTADTRIMRLQEDGGGSPEPHGGDAVGQTGVMLKDAYASNADTGDGNVLEWDIAPLVEEWLSGGSPNYGLMISSGSVNNLHFNSREGSRGAPPALQVVISDPKAKK